MTENENINALRDLAEQANGMIHWEINSAGARKIYETVISTLDLINRQKAEIERLKEQVNLWQEEAGSVGCANEWLKASLKNAKAEAIKEFAERLKEEEFASGVFGASYCREKIDNLVKEMVGDTE